MMNINEITIGEARELASLFTSNQSGASPFQVGKYYFIRTVTMNWCGKLKVAGSSFLTLESGTAAWVADSGRFYDALKDPSKFNEVEPAVNDVFIGVGSIIDATEIDQFTPSQK